ncbi:MAG: TonB-dependent receptor [Acidobacteria bacterium]|nr:TonB-dependent receptor [Acidobacteriota bacterium]
MLCRTGFAAAMFLLAAASPSFSQEFRGTITGRVTDTQSAAIPNAKIVATQVSTGARSNTNTGVDGLYTIPFLAPGSYKLEVEAPGFKRYVQDGLTVSAGERVGVDIQLQLGQINETVTVTAEAPLLDTTSATAGQVINSAQVENMPMNGRTPLVLAQLAMGVVPNSDPKFNRPFDNAGPSGFSMGGAPSQSNELLVDGAPDTTWDLRVSYNPPVDAVQEVRVHAFEADAAYGHTGGGTANVIMRGGSNNLHGSLYEFNQVSALQATNFFTNKAGQTKPVGRYNQWGGTAGGPLWIPKVFNGKNKVFWFFAMEEINDSFPEPQTLMVPTAAQRTGDLSQLLQVGANYQIYDPLTGVQSGSRISRTPFAGNIVPTSRINAIAKNYFQFYPLPNQPGGRDGTLNYLAPAVRKDTYNSEMGRLDFNIGSRNRMFWNFRHNDRIEDRNNLFNNAAAGRDLLRINWGSTLDDVHTFNASTVANFRLNFSRFREATVSYGDGVNATTLGFPAYISANAPKLVLPLIRFASTTAGSDYQQITSDTDSNRPFNIFQIFGDVVKIVGNHSLKMGADAREARDSNQSYGSSQGVYTFSTNWTRGPLDNSTAAPVGQDLAAFLLGMPTAGSFDINALRTNTAKYLAVFIQDDWRVRNNLTLNLGLRWERDFPNYERFNRSLNGFDSTTPSPIAAAAQAAYALKPDVLTASQFKVLGGPTFASASSRAIYSPQSRMFSPRLGVAWTANAKTVIRGGGGVFMFPINNPSYYLDGFSQATSMIVTNNSYLTPAATLSDPFPSGFLQPTGSSLGIATNLGRSFSYYNPTPVNPYSVRWQIGVQRELPGQMVLEVAYIGNHAVHLNSLNRNMDAVPANYLSTSMTRDQATIDYLSALVPNPFAGLIPTSPSLNGSTISRQSLLTPYPQFTGITLTATNAASSYFHSMDVRVEKRYAHGLSVLANFTYSKLIAEDNYKNPTDLAPEKRVASDDRPLRFVLSGSYELPFGRGKWLDTHNRVMNKIVGGWVLNSIYTNQIGAPLTFGSNIIFYGGSINSNPHPSNLDKPIFDTTHFNTISSQQLASNIATFGTRYGSLRQDGADNVDLSMIKDTAITEKVKLQFRFEAFNAFNRPSFDPPNLTVTSSAFGKITTQPNLPRSIQMALRLAF